MCSEQNMSTQNWPCVHIQVSGTAPHLSLVSCVRRVDDVTMKCCVPSVTQAKWSVTFLLFCLQYPISVKVKVKVKLSLCFN
jgi:hypothetical protein